MGGNMSLNGGNSGFLLFFVGTLSGASTVRLFTFQAPIVNGSTSVTGSFTFKIQMDKQYSLMLIKVQEQHKQ
jgi:hypothetical protein